MAAALAYQALFSAAPLLLLLLDIAGRIVAADDAAGGLRERVVAWSVPAARPLVEGWLDASRAPAGALWREMLALGLALFGATNVVVELQSGIERLWLLPPSHASLWRQTLGARVTAVALVVAAGALMASSLAAEALLASLAERLPWDWAGRRAWLVPLHVAADLALMAVVFALAYRLLPRTGRASRLSWSASWAAAAAASALFTIARRAVGLYVDHAAFDSVYGAAGAAVTLLLWFGVSMQIVLWGAMFGRTLDEAAGEGHT